MLSEEIYFYVQFTSEICFQTKSMLDISIPVI